MNIRMLALALLASFGAASAANAAVVIDKSALAINSSSNGFGPNGGVQFVNQTTFVLDTVQILLGLDAPGTLTFQVIEFDGALGDADGTVIGTILNVAVGGLPFDDFATKSVIVDASSLNLTLTAGVVYAFVFHAPGGNVRGGSTGNGDTDATVGSIFNGNGLGGPFGTSGAFEIPFIATSVDAAIPLPAALPLFLAGIAGIGFARRKARA